MTAEIAGVARDHRRVTVGMVGVGVVTVPVRDAEAAAEIEMVDVVAVVAQRSHEIGGTRERRVERREIGDLRADMHVDAGDAYAGQFGGVRIDVARARDRNAELVFGLARRDLGMRLRIDVGIDAQRRSRAVAPRLRRRCAEMRLELGFGLRR